MGKLCSKLFGRRQEHNESIMDGARRAGEEVQDQVFDGGVDSEPAGPGDDEQKAVVEEPLASVVPPITGSGKTIPNGPKTVKIVLVGDTSVGKSCLIRNYLENSFSDEYEPTVLDVYKGVKNVKRKQINVEIHDTSGDEHLGVNRQVQYH